MCKVDRETGLDCFEKVVGWVVVAVIAVNVGCYLTGCGEVYCGHRPTDSVRIEQRMNDKSWYCRYFPCDAKKGD